MSKSTFTGRPKQFKKLDAETLRGHCVDILGFIMEAAPFDETTGLVKKIFEPLQKRSETDTSKLTTQFHALMMLAQYCNQNAITAPEGHLTLNPQQKGEFLRLLKLVQESLEQDASAKPSIKKL
jgi:hypothetical protein